MSIVLNSTLTQHNDIKMDNIMIKHMRAYLIDLGCAHVIGGSGDTCLDPAYEYHGAKKNVVFSSRMSHTNPVECIL